MIRTLILFLAALLLTCPARAHDGPPYPIFVDEELGAWQVSIWTDPDVGLGTFYFYVEGPSEPVIHLEALPVDGYSPAVTGVARKAAPEQPYQQVAELPFDVRGTWTTRIALEGVERELQLDLDVTPEGLGPVAVSLYVLPFLIVALLWLRALLAQRRHDRQRSDSPSSGPDSA